MSQDNLFPHFQAPFDPSLYHPDMSTMQFAASVPHRPSSNTSSHHPTRTPLPMNFPPFPSVDMSPMPNYALNYPASPYDRPETGKQVQSKAERRAEHNATERARRESLNAKFLQLAFTLPTLQNDSRPSKGTIIDRTLDFVKGAILKEERLQYRINELEKFSRYLLSELDKKNSIKEEQTSPVLPTELALSPPLAPASVAASEDSFVEDIKTSNSSTSSSHKKLNIHNNKENGPTKRRRPVSHSSVSSVPKLDYNNKSTNWPTTTANALEQFTTSTHTSPVSLKQVPPPSTNYQLLQQQQQLLDQQQLLKEQHHHQPMNLYSHSFHPPTTTTTTTYHEPEDTFFDGNYMLNHNFLMDSHRH